jgi:hypothetical protein
MPTQIRFITTKAFEKAAKSLFTAIQISGLRMKLAMNPQLGDLIPRTGGARKVRHVGMRGQSRVIYYYHSGQNEIFFLACYSKNVKENLTVAETKVLAAIVKDIKEARR